MNDATVGSPIFVEAHDNPAATNGIAIAVKAASTLYFTHKYTTIPKTPPLAVWSTD
jgi:hypothetical protein